MTEKKTKPKTKSRKPKEMDPVQQELQSLQKQLAEAEKTIHDQQDMLKQCHKMAVIAVRYGYGDKNLLDRLGEMVEEEI